jgi:hypothetical protein
VKHKEYCRNDAEKSHQIVPLRWLAQIRHGKDSKDKDCKHFLDGLQLGCRELIMTDAVGRDLKAVPESRDEPANENNSQEGSIFIWQMTIPGKGHEDI